jgi:hypothetical protein
VSQCKCLRCGHEWTPRAKRIFFQGGIGERHVEYIERESKRCARCRSPYWNKMYVRLNQNRPPGSIGFQPSLPFTSHSAGVLVLERPAVSSKPKFSQIEVLEMTPKERVLIKMSPSGKTALATRLKFDARAKAFPTSYAKFSPPKRTVAGTRKKVQTSQRRRAAAPLGKPKHGKTKQGKQ